MQEKATSTKEFILSNFAWIALVLMAIANLWLGSKLAPVAQDIEIIKHDVKAIELSVTEKVDNKEFALLCSKIDDLQDNLNYLVGLHIIP